MCLYGIYLNLHIVHSIRHISTMVRKIINMNMKTKVKNKSKKKFVYFLFPIQFDELILNNIPAAILPTYTIVYIIYT